MSSNKEYYDHRCACGCGGKIEIRERHGREKDHPIPNYITGHHMRKKRISENMFQKRYDSLE